jgi:prevent-host-death family protein
MKEIPAGKFKTHCLTIMDEVQATGKPVLVTKHGNPVVKLVPAKASEDRIFGYMVGKARIVGDVVSPVAHFTDWHAVK